MNGRGRFSLDSCLAFLPKSCIMGETGPFDPEREDAFVEEFEIYVENITSCGGEKYAKRELVEAEGENPEACVRALSPWPIVDVRHNNEGDLVFLCADGNGNMIRYTFTG